MRQNTLAVCMIVKNESANLSLTLPNNVKHSDSVVLVDTGSSDDTVETAIKAGARVHHFKWVGDFSAARNYSISKADEDWILWLDADEYIDDASFSVIRDCLNTSKADVIYLPIYECEYKSTQGDSFYLRDKLFRNKKGAGFIKPVNEQLVFPPDIRPVRADLLEARICHWGMHLPKDDMDRKMTLRLELLERTAAADPGDYAIRYLLGTRYQEMGRFEEALEKYDSTISLCGTDAGSEGIKKYFCHAALAQRARIFFESGKYREALAESAKAMVLAPALLDPCDCAVSSLFKLNRYEEALEITEQMIKMPKLRHPVLLFSQNKWDTLPQLLHARALLMAKGRDAAEKFALSVLEKEPANNAMGQLMEVIKKLP